MIATVHTTTAVLVVAVFLASAVEMVEALTIVVAVGVTQGWRTALAGSAAALAVLAVLVGALGPALLAVPLPALRLVIGGLLLVFGLQWLRKAVLRASGHKAKHDEDAIFAEQVAALSSRGTPSGPGPAARRPVDRTGMVVAFKGVFLEGLEVVVIVLTLGSTDHDVPVAALAAAAAVVLVGIVGAVVARQLSGVPENAMKMAVGLMLVSYGTFWVGEAAKVHWPGSDLAIVGLVVVYGAVSWLVVRILAQRVGTTAPAPVVTVGGHDG
jgi:uncharacterized membrane protein